ncbi:MAG TPA: hypothetical protein VLX58_15945 [Bryobacteraceae bacterium]|nr:hypothetical protein [Bryobacteraceae bacterium]
MSPAPTATTDTRPAIPAALHPAFEISKEVTGMAAASQPASGRGEVAFAARIAERPMAPAPVVLRNTTPATAASRFEASATDSLTESAVHVEPQAPVAKKSDTSNPPAQVSSDQQAAQGAGDRQPSADSGASHDNNEPGPADQPAGTAATAHAASDTPNSPLAAAQPQSAASGIPAPGPLLVNPSGPRDAAPAKSTLESSVAHVPDLPGDQTARSGESVRAISLRLSSADQGAVQVRLSERAGELHLSVRTPDTGLSRGLRDGLSELVGRLETTGYRAEMWQPGGSGSSPGQQGSHDGPSHGNSQQRNSGGSGSGQQQNPRDQQPSDEQTPKWVHELESSFQRSKSTWPASSIP